MLRLRPCALPLITAVLLLQAPALAQDAAAQAAAQELFDAGRKLMDAGSYAEACPKLAASAKLDPGAGTLLNLAACYEKNGQTASAWVTYKDASAAASSSGKKDWAAKADQKAAALEGKLSRLKIEVQGEPLAGLLVRRDDALLNSAELGLGIPVDPGTRKVSASAPGYEAWSTEVEVAPGAGVVTVAVPSLVKMSETTSAVPAAPTQPAPMPTVKDAPADGSAQRTLGLALGGLGLVGVGFGTFMGLQAKSQHDEALDKYCRTDTICTQEGADRVDDAKSSATLSTVGFLVGGAALATGVVLYVSAPSGDAQVAVRSGPTQSQISFQGVF